LAVRATAMQIGLWLLYETV